MYKKNCIILFAFIIAFASVFAIPQKKAEAAVPLAIAAGGGVAVGTYVVGALAIGGAIHGIGTITNSEAFIESGRVTNEHASQVWGKSTQVAKDASADLYNQALSGGEYIQGLPASMKDFYASSSTTIAQISAMIQARYESIETPEKFALEGSGVYYGNNPSNPDAVSTIDVSGSFVAVSVGLIGSNAVRNGNVTEMAGIRLNRVKTATGFDLRVMQSSTWISQRPMSDAVWERINSGLLSPVLLAQTLSGMGHNVTAMYPELWQTVPGISASINNDALPRMDAGLVVPVNDFPRTNTGEALRVDPVTGASTTMNPVNGAMDTPYSGDIVWSPTIPAPYTIPANPAIPGSIPATGMAVPGVTTGTTTAVPVDVYTGNPTVPGGSVPGTGTPEDGASCARIKFPIFSPLKEQFSITFPFSIPWDIGRAINAAFSEIGDDKPEFELDLKVMDKKHTINITMPKMFDDWKPFTDSLLLFIFDVLIMFGIYRFVKGAGS